MNGHGSGIDNDLSCFKTALFPKYFFDIGESDIGTFHVVIVIASYSPYQIQGKWK
jgi:hypothetical protein